MNTINSQLWEKCMLFGIFTPTILSQYKTIWMKFKLFFVCEGNSKPYLLPRCEYRHHSFHSWSKFCQFLPLPPTTKKNPVTTTPHTVNYMWLLKQCEPNCVHHHSRCLENMKIPARKLAVKYSIWKAICQKITSVLTNLTPVIFPLIKRRSIIWSYCPSLKYSFSVLLKRLENLTNSLFRCSRACLPVVPGMKPATSFTASSSFLIALAISLKRKKVGFKTH